MTQQELEQLAKRLIAELRAGEKLAIAGSVTATGLATGTSCTCDGRCTCNGNCSCNSKGDCGCNTNCPCDSKSVPSEVQWFIDPDPTAWKAITILNAAGDGHEMLEALKNIRAGLKVQGPKAE